MISTMGHLLYTVAVKTDKPFCCGCCCELRKYCGKKCKGRNIVYEWRRRRDCEMR
jgi:hypothetical protein